MTPREYLKADIDVKARAGWPEEASAVARFIAEHGIEFEGKLLPGSIKRGEPKLCFMNAALLADTPGLRYVEGYGFRDYLKGYPFQHAWCIDDQNRVVDPTWDDKDIASTYIGVMIPHDLLWRELLKHKHYGVLSLFNGQPNLPLINELRELAGTPLPAGRGDGRVSRKTAQVQALERPAPSTLSKGAR